MAATTEPRRRYGYDATTAQCYDLFNPPNPLALDVRFFLHYALRAGAAVELGAGTGRIALVLAAHGLPVTAVEPSAPMRGALRIKAAQQPGLLPQLTVLDTDAATFQLPTPAPLIYLCGMFHNLLGADERLAALRNVAQHLTDDGCFLCPVGLGASASQPLVQIGEAVVGSHTYRLHFEQQVLAPPHYEMRFVYETWRGDERVAEAAVYARGCDTKDDDLVALADASGLALCAAFGDYQWTPFVPNAHAQIVAEFGWP